MSTQYSADQIIQQNENFQIALRTSKITQEQYNQAMTVQNANLAAVQAKNRANAGTNTTGQATPFSPQLTVAASQNPTMKNIVVPAFEVSAAVAGAVAAPVVAPLFGVGATSVLIGEAVGVGLNEVPVTNVLIGQPINLPKTPQDALMRGATGAVEGGVFSIVGGSILGKVASVAPSLAGEVANPFVRAATRIGVNAGLGAGSSALLSGGNPTATLEGAGFGAAFGAISEGIGVVTPKIYGQLPKIDTDNLWNRFLNRVSPDWREPFSVNTEGPKTNPVYDMYKNSNGGWGTETDWAGGTELADLTPTTNKMASLNTKSYSRIAYNKLPALPDSNTPITVEPFTTQDNLKSNFDFSNYSSPSRNTKVNSWGFNKPTNYDEPTNYTPKPLLQLDDLPQTKGRPYMETDQFPDARKLLNSRVRLGNTALALVTNPKLESASLTSRWQDGINSWGYKKASSPSALFKLDIATKNTEEPFLEPWMQTKNSWGFQKRTKQSTKNSLTTLTMPSANQLPKTTLKNKTALSPDFRPNIKPKGTLTTNPTTRQRLRPDLLINPDIRPNIKPKYSLNPVPEVRQKLRPLEWPQTSTNTASKNRFPNIPKFGFGGGFDNSGTKNNKSGLWFEKKHKIKTYSQMLNTFGVGKAAKPLRKLDKAITPKLNKLDKATSKFLTKTFKPKQPNRKRR